MRRVVFALWVGLLAGCDPSPAPNAPPEPVAPGVEPELATGRTIYSYTDERGRIRMATSIDQIPVAHRDQVVATDTGRTRAERLASDRLVVLDLRRTEAGRPLNYSVVDLGQAATGPASGVDEPIGEPGALGRELVRRAAGSLGLAPARAGLRVILYTAPWCGFCQKAAAYLRERGVDFEQRDIEASRQAAVELDRKLRAAGLQGAGIPVLDIDGKLVVGFDRARIEALLAGR